MLSDEKQTTVTEQDTCVEIKKTIFMTSVTNADRNKGPLKRAVRRFPHKSQIKTSPNRHVLMAHKDALRPST